MVVISIVAYYIAFGFRKAILSPPRSSAVSFRPALSVEWWLQYTREFITYLFALLLFSIIITLI